MHPHLLSRPAFGGLVLAAALVAGPALAETAPAGAPIATTFNVDVSGILSFGEFGDPGNTVLTLDIGGLSTVVGVGWNVTLEAFSPSWLSEIGVTMGSTAQAFELLLEPGAADTFTSGMGSYSSGGIIDLVGLGLQFDVGADGVLRMEFNESLSDFAAAADGRWVSGSLTIEVSPIPEPATYGLMGLGLALVAAAAARRRRAS